MRRALLLVLVLPLAGCGGSGSGDDAPAKPARPTQKQFVSAANAVCLRSDRAIYDLGTLTTDPAGWQATAHAGRTAIAEMRKQKPPAGKDAAFQLLLTRGQALVAAIQRVREALVAQDYAKARAAQAAATKADAAVHAQAKKLGLTFCQQALTNWPA